MHLATSQTSRHETSAALDSLKARIEEAFFSHPVILDNPYTKWFKQGQAGAEDVRDLLEMTEDLWPTQAESPLWHAPNARESEKISKPLSRVANKWLPWLQTKWKEEFGLALVLVVIYGTRRKAYLATLRAERERKSDSGGRGEPANP